jgi:LPS export ABC transporter protein LptC
MRKADRLPINSSEGSAHCCLGAVLFCLGIIILFLSGCSFSYKDEIQPEIEQRPDYILNETSYTISRSNLDTITFTAGKATFHTSDARVMLEQVLFTQKDRDGMILTEGEAVNAEINTDTNDIVLEGDVRLHSVSEQIIITSPRLFWKHESNELTAGDSLVSITYQDGSRISGRGFRANGEDRVFEFAQNSEGVVRYE